MVLSTYCCCRQVYNLEWDTGIHYQISREYPKRRRVLVVKFRAADFNQAFRAFEVFKRDFLDADD